MTKLINCKSFENVLSFMLGYLQIVHNKKNKNINRRLFICVSKTLTLSFSVASQILLPANVTVLKGSDAQINAIVLTQWTSMTWTVDGTLVLIFYPSDNSTDTSRYSASLCITGDTTCVQFIIRNVTRNDMVVECDVLGLPGSRTQLDVQGKARNNFSLFLQLVHL